MSGERAMATLGAVAFAFWFAYCLYELATSGTVWIPAGRHASGSGGWVSFAEHPASAAVALAAYAFAAIAFAVIARRGRG